MIIIIYVFIAIIICAILNNPVKLLLDLTINKSKLQNLNQFFKDVKTSHQIKIENDVREYKSKIENLKDWALKDIQLSNQINNTEVSLRIAHWVKDKIQLQYSLEKLKKEQAEIRKQNVLNQLYAINNFKKINFKTKLDQFSSNAERRQSEINEIEIINTYHIFNPTNVSYKE